MTLGMKSPQFEMTTYRRTHGSLGFAILIVLVIIVTLGQEYSTPDGPQSWLYSTGVGPFRSLDIIVLTLTYFAILEILAKRDQWGKLEQPFLAPSVTAFIAVVLSVAVGIVNGGQELFFDWRNLFLGCLFFWLLTRYCWNAGRISWILQAVISANSVQAAWLLFQYARGGGVTLLSLGRIPVYNGDLLTSAVFCVAFLLSRSWHSRLRLWEVIVLLLTTSLILLSLRRTYWGELLTVIGVALVSMRERGRASIVSVGLILTGLSIPLWFEDSLIALRLRSMNPWLQIGEYTQTNRDHVDDLLDAIDVIRDSPVFGIGQGLPYKTSRIVGWKDESWGVHNGPLHVWVKYGLLGLGAYFWFHFVFLRYAWRHIRELKSPDLRAMALGSVCFLVAKMLVSLAFSPWPYGSFVSSMLMFLSMACVFVSVSQDHSSLLASGSDWEGVSVNFGRGTA